MIKAVQQIMLGSVIKDEKSALHALKRIKQAGYDSIELNSFMIERTGPLVRLLTSAAGMPTGSGGKLDWLSLLKESDLSVIALHTDLGSLEHNSGKIIQKAKAYATKYVVITGMYRFDYGNFENVCKLSKRLNIVGKILEKAGLTLCYHNHNIEFTKLSNNECAFDLIIKNTDPEYVSFELDTFWLTDSGADAAKYMNILHKRMKLWHITDRCVKIPKNPITPIVKTDSCELGFGSMNLDDLYSIAAENKVSGIILETHKNCIEGNPLKSIEKSADWLRKVQA